jgi:glutamate synthase domain-containing protein 1
LKWENYTSLPELYKNERVFDGCGISGYINLDGKKESGEKIIEMLCILSERENGLGAGFAGYGLYPEFKDYYAFHLLFEDELSKSIVLEFLKSKGEIIKSEPIPTNIPPNVEKTPIVWRIFFDPDKNKVLSEDEIIVKIVMDINENFENAFVMSSGKNMGVFKGNGWSYEIADFYKISSYKAYMWLAHSRFPTNTPGWWGGAHPFNLINTSVVHNGEITSYGTNKRYLDSFGYKCMLFTDTEVIAYLIDLLCRKHNIPILIATLALAPPLFQEIEKLDEKSKVILKEIRATYRSAMLNGPFSIIVGYANPTPMLIGLSDRKKLRPLVAAISEDENSIFMSSEEASFNRLMFKDSNLNFKKIWHPKSGTAIVAKLGDGLIRDGLETPFEKTNLFITGAIDNVVSP